MLRATTRQQKIQVHIYSGVKSVHMCEFIMFLLVLYTHLRSTKKFKDCVYCMFIAGGAAVKMSK